MSILSLVVLLVGLRPGLAASYGHPSALIWKDQLFAASNGYLFDQDYLYRGTFQPERKAIRSPLPYWNSATTMGSCQAKVGVRDDRLLLTESSNSPLIVSFTELALLEATALGERLIQLHGYPNYSFLVDRAVGGDSRHDGETLRRGLDRRTNDCRPLVGSERLVLAE